MPEPSDRGHADVDLEVVSEVCGYLSGFLDKGTWHPSTVLEDVLFRTLARGRGTFDAIVELVLAERSLQAAMLGRSLFEDMAVAHWLVLHRDNAEWLLRRFFDHEAAMRLHDAATRERLRPGEPAPDVAELVGREAHLRAEYGRYAEREWWGKDRDGTRITMPLLVERLAAAEEFRPRLRGEAPILEQYYSLQHKAWTQTLHHTAVGIYTTNDGDGRFATAVAGVPAFMILYGNYWVFGQLTYVTLWHGAPSDAADHFYKQFLAGLAVFGEMIGVPAPWADETARWAEGL